MMDCQVKPGNDGGNTWPGADRGNGQIDDEGEPNRVDSQQKAIRFMALFMALFSAPLHTPK